MKIHPSITSDRIIKLINKRNTTLDNPGLCIACGNEQDGCEPDARDYECEECGHKTVYAPEELLITGF